jgi:hypothetical protein
MVQVAVTLADLGTDLGRQGVQVGAPRAAGPPGALGEQKQSEDLHADPPHHRHECRLRGGPCRTTGAISTRSLKGIRPKQNHSVGYCLFTGGSLSSARNQESRKETEHDLDLKKAHNILGL